MNFASDNWAGAAPEISQALERHAAGYATAYGDGDLDQHVYGLFQKIFETDCSVFFTGTGTAANSLALAATTRPGGVAFCHSEAHLIANEGGASEFLTGGGRLIAVDGGLSKIDPENLLRAIHAYPKHFNHLGQGTAISITQTTEGGTCYSLDELSAIGDIAKDNKLPLHMDGARFANAIVNLECSPADMTWKRGVDMVSFGGTKNGCWCAEALVIFDPELAGQAHFVRKRMGHLFSKSRFISAQFEAYLSDDLWLQHARHSNQIGMLLREMIENHPNARLAWESDTNQIFMIAKREDAERWLEKGATFYPFPAPNTITGSVAADEQVYRLVTSFISTEEDVAALEGIMSAPQ